MMARLTDNEGRLTRDFPNWGVRSVLELSTGRWRMRNGHIAVVKRFQKFPCTRIADGKPTTFTVWFGRCEICDEGCSWNTNGTYAASGIHQWDILGPA